MTAVPPLLLLAQGRKPRARKAPAPRPKELALHLAVAKLLRDHCLPDWRWWHTPSGEHRDIRTAAKLKAMGVRPGVPDFILLSPAESAAGHLFQTSTYFLELKRPGGKLTEEQHEFQHWCIVNGAVHSVAETIDEVLDAVAAWGCLRITIAPRRKAE